MITTGEARRAAEAWLQEEARRYPELVGALLAGSTRTRAPTVPHPPGSDVDLFLYVDAEVPSDIVAPRGRYAPRKLGFHGVVLEPSFHEARLLADPAAVLGDMHLAPLFTDPCLLLDPHGRLGALAAAVTPEFRRPCYAQRRLTQALGAAMPNGSPFAIPDVPALRAPCWRHVAFGFAVLRCASAVLVAGLRYPTTRRSFVAAREVLAPNGRHDVAEDLLRLLGSSALSRAQVEELTAETERAYDSALAVRRTPVVMDWNVSHDARELERAGIRELVDSGYHREALYQLLLVRTIAQGIIENDASAPVRAESRVGYQRLLCALGIDSDEALAARADALRAFMPTLRETCKAVLASTCQPACSKPRQT